MMQTEATAEAFMVSRFLQDTTTTTTSSEDEESNALAVAVSNIFLFFLIFGLSATVEVKNLKKQLQNKFAITTGVSMQFLIMPVLGFISVTALKNQSGWTKEMGIALLVVTSSPGGSYSNWWCSMFNADLALSVAMTTVSSLLSMAMLPLNLFFYTFLTYGKDGGSVVQALDFKTIFMALGIVLFAITSGLYAGYRYDNKRFHVWANRLGSLSGILLVLASVFISSGGTGDTEHTFWNQQWPFYVGVAFPCLVGIALANVISRSMRLPGPETVSIAIECCYQNTGIATSVAIAMYSDPDLRAQAVAVPLFYGVVEAVAIFFYCLWAWKMGWTKAPANERFCVMLTSTYEVDENENEDNVNMNDEQVNLAAPAARARLPTDNSEDDGSNSNNSRFDDESLGSIQETATRPFWIRWFAGAKKRPAAAAPPVAEAKGLNESLSHMSPGMKPPRNRSFTMETTTTSTSSAPASSPSTPATPGRDTRTLSEDDLIQDDDDVDDNNNNNDNTDDTKNDDYHRSETPGTTEFEEV